MNAASTETPTMITLNTIDQYCRYYEWSCAAPNDRALTIYRRAVREGIIQHGEKIEIDGDLDTVLNADDLRAHVFKRNICPTCDCYTRNTGLCDDCMGTGRTITTPRKTYTTPTMHQLIAVPPTPFVTVYQFRDFLSEWYLPDLENLYDLLCMAQAARVSTGVMIGFVGAAIERCLPKLGVTS